MDRLYKNYLERYAYNHDALVINWNKDAPDIIVVMPVHNEPDIIGALEAIEACVIPDGNVSIISVINASENADQKIKDHNLTTYHKALEWSRKNKKYQYYFILDNELPKKHAGVGLARKIGMDEAAKVFISNDKDGVILCFDADSTCSDNLLIEVERLFRQSEVNGCSIQYAHPLESEELDINHLDGIIKYELHLRYYVDALKYAEYPFAYQTIGSSMAVRMSAYVKQGGMNRRKAGEDFYFLHKIIPLGGFYNLNSASIYPSPRRSDRVPFGTGRAISQWLDDQHEDWMTYDFRIFDTIKIFLSQIDTCYNNTEEQLESNYESLEPEIKSFISKVEYIQLFIQINNNTATIDKFMKRFYQWFDGFRVLKLVHHIRDEFYENITIVEACKWILNKYGIDAINWSVKEMLIKIRALNQKEVLLVT